MAAALTTYAHNPSTEAALQPRCKRAKAPRAMMFASEILDALIRAVDWLI